VLHDLRSLDLAQPGLAARVLELQRSAYLLEAEWIGDDRIPPLHDTLEELQTCGETFLGAFVGGTLAGFISWRRDGDTLDLHRLAVDPAFAKRGIGRSLVCAAQASESASWVTVQTGAANEPAKALYRSEGFVAVGDVEVVPGLWVTRFEKHEET